MKTTQQPRPKNLGVAEHAVMDHVWKHGPISAEACREAMQVTRPMKESTVRTMLRRLEDKGYVTHSIEGRTYIYQAAESSVNVAARVVKHLIDRLCGGSAEELVIGMVDNAVLSAAQLERLAKRIAEQKEQKGTKK